MYTISIEPVNGIIGEHSTNVYNYGKYDKYNSLIFLLLFKNTKLVCVVGCTTRGTKSCIRSRKSQTRETTENFPS